MSQFIMPMDYILEVETLPSWKKLKNHTLKAIDGEYENLCSGMDSYSLVYVLVDEAGRPTTLKRNSSDTESFVIFSTQDLVRRATQTIPSTFKTLNKSLKSYFEEDIPHAIDLGQENLKIMMLGELVDELKKEQKEASIKINPVFVELSQGIEPYLFSEDVVFAPQLDNFTQKLLLTDPEDAKALLAISPEDQKRFGIELVFYMMTTRGLPDEKEERERLLREEIEKLSYIAPRTPIKKGSGSFLAVLLNLENDFEERAFIRSYSMFDSHSDIVFVTSNLELLDGRLEDIPFKGDKIDTIFMPLINWQRRKQVNQVTK